MSMIIDYTEFDKSSATSIKAIENRGHVRYIRYLISKRIPPTSIRKELARLALSAPDKGTIVNYFINIFLPILNKYGITNVYKQYYERILNAQTETDVSPILSFSISFEKNDAERIAFCKFIRELEIEEMWSREVTRFYGGINNIPQNEDGERIIKANVTRSVENVLTCPKRYLVDKLLLENIAVTRISRYLWEKYQVKLSDNDLYAYSRYFFNFERKGIEEVIEQLVIEQTSIKNDLDILDSNNDWTLGEKLSIAKQYEDKLIFLDESIKDLNSRYSDLSYKQGIAEKMTMHNIVEDIVHRGYDRLKKLDRYNDRDVVKPLTEVAKMVFNAIDKMQQIENNKNKGEGTVSDKNKDAQEILIEAYTESYERHIEEAKNKLGEPKEGDNDLEIEGLEEV